MYTPAHFNEDRIPVLHELIRSHPLASLVTTSAGALVVTHLPLVLAGSGKYGVLRGHVPRANPVWRDLEQSSEAVAIFHGPDRYISPNWYPSKRAHGKVVPTWNYAVVHVHGSPCAIQDVDWLRDHLNALTGQQEASQPSPWKVDDAPEEFTGALVESLVGIEIPISSMEGKWKVSQNRPAEDRQGIASALLAAGDDASLAMAGLVQNAYGHDNLRAE